MNTSSGSSWEIPRRSSRALTCPMSLAVDEHVREVREFLVQFTWNSYDLSTVVRASSSESACKRARPLFRKSLLEQDIHSEWVEDPDGYRWFDLDTMKGKVDWH